MNTRWQLDRNLADAHSAIGFGKIFIGRAEETEAHIGEALRLSPRDTMAYIWMTTAGMAKLHLGSYEQAVAWFRRAIEANRNYPPAYLNLAAALAQLGRLDEARSAVKAGLPSTRPTPSPAPEPPGRRGATTRRISPSLSLFSTACARPESPNNDRDPPPCRHPRRRRRRLLAPDGRGRGRASRGGRRAPIAHKQKTPTTYTAAEASGGRAS